MIDLSRDGYTHQEIVNALHSAVRADTFGYELLDTTNRKIKDLKTVSMGTIKFGMLNSIKRTAEFRMTGDEGINFLNQRIRPSMYLQMPKAKAQERSHHFLSHTQAVEKESNQTMRPEWVKFPLGVFLLSSPTRTGMFYGEERSITCYGLTQILHDDKFTSTHSVEEGAIITDEVITILASAGITEYNIPSSDKIVPRTLQFEVGTKKIEAINHLLSMINYTPIYDDENGYFTSAPYRTPAERSADYVYQDDSRSLILPGVEEELDLFNVANTFVVVRTNAEETPLKSVLVNENPDSPLSTVNRNRVIVDYREIEDIADQEALDSYTERIAFEASQVYGRIRWRSALMPFHGYGNVLQFNFGSMGISGKYLELGWEMQLQVGGVMSHELRQVVSL